MRSCSKPDLRFPDQRLAGLFDEIERAAQEAIRSGVPQVVAQEITAHRTREVFDRYNITTTEEAREAILATVRRLRPENSYGLSPVDAGISGAWQRK